MSAASLYAAAGLRSFVTGLTGVLLGLYLAEIGVGATRLGLVVGAGLAGLAVATALVAWFGERIGRRTTLYWATFLSAGGAAGVAVWGSSALLPLVAFVGMVNGMGRDRGPAQTLEQSLLADAVADARRTQAFTRYSLAQDVAGALGSLAATVPAALVSWWSLSPSTAYRLTFAGAAVLSLLPAIAYAHLPAGPDAPHPSPGRTSGVSRATRHRVTGLASLFALDSVGGGLLAGSILTYWFFHRFGLGAEVLGPVFFAARGLNAASYVGAECFARRIGLIPTMVFTHLPSSALLVVLPFVPSAPLAVMLFLGREALVQMDVPTRQSFVAAVTSPGERTFALGVTGLVRNVGWALGPPLAGVAMRAYGLGAPLLLGAGFKMVYDLALYASFRRVRPPEEVASA